MFGPFKLNKPLGSNFNVDLEDTLRTKKALLELGYYKTPKHGLTKYPDERLFKSIKKFQDDNGLMKDGLMKPGGQTERTMQASLGMEHSAKDAVRVDTVAVENAFVVTRYAVAIEAVMFGRGNTNPKDKK
ncbi:MAG TPA: hypothetical protein ENI69_04760 [Rhodospirillales bacterium]|nr:hypothetical protein [Rhodospirillales bacterium]